MASNPQQIYDQAVNEFNAQHFSQVIKLLKPLVKARIVSPDAYNLLGSAQVKSGKVNEGFKSFKASLKLDARYPATHLCLANAYREGDKPELSFQHYERAFKLNPSNPRPLLEMSQYHQSKEEWALALPLVKRFLEAGGDPAEGNIHQAVCQYGLYQYQEAQNSLDVAEAIKPSDTTGLYYRAMLLDKTGKKQEAEKILLDLISTRQHLSSCFTLSLLYFSIGRWQEAFEYYEYRPVAKALRSQCQTEGVTYWDGQDIKGKKLFVLGEQGLGDQIRYLFFLQTLLEEASEVAVFCDARLYPIIQNSFPGIQCVKGKKFHANMLSQCHPDFAMCIGSLGRKYHQRLADREAGTSLEPPGFIAASAKCNETIASSFPKNGKPSIGVSWRSIRFMAQRNDWYLSAAEMAGIFSDLDVNVISLQYALAPEERQAFIDKGISLIEVDDIDLKDDQVGLADLISQLDSVISVSTSLSELAGAAGVPAIIFSVRDIRWFMSESHIKGFYPRTDIVYKDVFGDWDSALDTASGIIESMYFNPKKQLQETT
jgi:hypothetical protein